MSMFRIAREIVKRNSYDEEAEDVQTQNELDGYQNVDYADAKATETSNKNRKVIYVDDGRPVADMNIEGFSWYNKHKFNEGRKGLVELKITRKERLAMILGALSAILPIVIFIGLAYGGAFLMLYFWMR